MRRNVYSPALRICSGAPGLFISFLIWLVLSIMSASGSDHGFSCGGGTLVLPSTQWGLPYGALCAFGMFGMALSAASLWLLNKRYNMLPGALYSSLLLIMCGTTPAVTRGFSPAVIMALITLGCTLTLFGLYGKRNATADCFLLFTCLGWGSMIQTSCLWLAGVFLIGLAVVQVFRLREVVASLLGLGAPYWIMLGLGLVTPDQLHIEAPHMVTALSGNPADLIWTLVTAGVTALGLLIMMLYNAITTPPAGVQVRAYNSFINLLGFAAVIFMIFDAERLPAYLMIAFMSLSFMTARCTSQSRSPRAWILPVCVAATYLLIYFLMQYA